MVIKAAGKFLLFFSFVLGEQKEEKGGGRIVCFNSLSRCVDSIERQKK